MKEYAKSFYKSAVWLKCRNAYIRERISIDGGICEECKDEQGYIVHHITALTKDNITDPGITLNYDNLMYVCKDCHDHYEGHGIRKHDINQRVTFDSTGQPIPIRPDKLQE